MVENPDGSGQFTEVLLRPAVSITDPAMRGHAEALHGEDNAMCFIARSVGFPVRHEPGTTVAS